MTPHADNTGETPAKQDGCAGFAARNGWAELTPRERNNHIGDIIKAAPLTQLCLMLDGKMLWLTPKDEKYLDELSGMVGEWQRTKKNWKGWQKISPELRDEWRGKITVGIERWHIRYYETPGGGWDVVEAIRKAGWSVQIETAEAGWKITCDDGNPHHGRVTETATTMQEAACLAAMRCFPPNDQAHPTAAGGTGGAQKGQSK